MYSPLFPFPTHSPLAIGEQEKGEKKSDMGRELWDKGGDKMRRKRGEGESRNCETGKGGEPGQVREERRGEGEMEGKGGQSQGK